MDVLPAVTATSWPAPVVRITLLVTVASAPLSTTLVAIWKAMPFVLPSANGLPPSVSATTLPVARIVAVSSAATVSACRGDGHASDRCARPASNVVAGGSARGGAGRRGRDVREVLLQGGDRVAHDDLLGAFAGAVARFTTVPLAPPKR